MANNCFYEMVAVAPKKETLERLISIMNYKDDEYFIYRCFSANDDGIYFDEKSKLYNVGINGDMAWGTSPWFEHTEKKDLLIMLGEKDGKTQYGTAHLVSLDILCQKLDMGIECFAEESGCAFQEFHSANHLGEVYADSAEWYEYWCDENGNELDEPRTEGGLDYMGDYSDYETIYG